MFWCPVQLQPLSQIYHLAVTQLLNAQYVLCVCMCVSLYICSLVCASVCGGQRSTLDIVSLFLFIYSGFFLKQGSQWPEASQVA